MTAIHAHPCVLRAAATRLGRLARLAVLVPAVWLAGPALAETPGSSITLNDPEPYATWVSRMVDTTVPGSITLSNNLASCSSSTGCVTWSNEVLHVAPGEGRARRITFYHELGHLQHMREGAPWLPYLGEPEVWAEAYVRCALADREWARSSGPNSDIPRWSQVQYERVCASFR